MSKAWIAFVAAALFSCTAHAERWRVDVIVVHDRNSGIYETENAVKPSFFNDGKAIPLGDTARLGAQGIKLLPDGDSILRQQWTRLSNSQRFEPVLRLAWVQTNPPRRGGPALLLRHGEPLRTVGLDGPLPRLEGTLRLTLRRFLHLHAHLEWRQTSDTADGPGVVAKALREERRMRSRTLHYIDGPGFGLLAHILPLDDAQ
ncbi:MAG: CsiV family protein [Algiphilus sp.]